jgi:hypothetical protein
VEEQQEVTNDSCQIKKEEHYPLLLTSAAQVSVFIQAPKEITTPVTPCRIAVTGQGKIMPYSPLHLLNLKRG